MPISLPAFIERGKGSHIYDIDGNDFIDYNLAFGPLILGHSHPAVSEAVKDQVDKGIVYAANTEAELELSEKFVHRVPCAEQVILTNTGSCAASIALRLARAYTRKQKVLKFEGHYHGWHDWDMVGTAFSVIGTFAKGMGQKTIGADGIAQSVYDDVIVLPWNDPELLEETIKRQGNEIAAVFTEGYQSNWGVMPPDKGYLELLRKLTRDAGIILVIDEVITGFRLGLGGAQELLGIESDISPFSKAMANGFPIAAIAGKEEFMEPIANDKTYIAGTFNGNAVSVAASIATINELEKFGSYSQMINRGKKVMNGIRDALDDNRVPGLVQGPGPMWSVYFTDMERINQTRQVYSIPFHPHVRRSAVFFQGLVNRGVMVSPARYGRMYFSFAHTDEDVDKTIRAASEALRETKKIEN
jgi:glutamate-1-semialdehyde 2,1-aminomutase